MHIYALADVKCSLSAPEQAREDESEGEGGCRVGWRPALSAAFAFSRAALSASTCEMSSMQRKSDCAQMQLRKLLERPCQTVIRTAQNP